VGQEEGAGVSKEGAAKKWVRVKDWLLGRQPEEELSEMEKLQAEIEQAHQEWAIAQQHMNHVSDPELIDHAIYHLEAAERKYGYLLREAKRLYEKEYPRQVEALLE
jgi:hypothetical protein